ncbi:MAG TPA: pitrilysin family protein [Balneolaceae bacterium]|nr:pitrilysin family protein [Balneolaceae bacterium]
MKLKKLISTLGLLALLSLPFYQAGYAQSLQDFEEKVTEFTLDNGLTFIVVERPVAPVVSFVTYVNVGGVNEKAEHLGVAHIFEHMAFKGTEYIGTTNWQKEKKVLKKLDKTYQKWLAEKNSAHPDSAKIDQLWSNFKKLQEEAVQYVETDEFSQIVSRNGGTGMNATTSSDYTMYFYSLPENRKELWFSLESARFKTPVFRRFYKEKNAVHEERRMRSESSPVGRLVEKFLTVAYPDHPYGRPVVGWHSTITATTIADAKAFFNTYYVPNNMTMAIAGDITAERAKELAKTYFGDIPTAPAPPPVNAEKPDQQEERRFAIHDQSQPFLLMGYHTVNAQHPDAKALELLGSVLASGRTSMLYKTLVDEKKIALGFQLLNGFPGDKYQSLFGLLGVPNRGVSVDSLETAIYEVIGKIKKGDIPQQALDRARTKARAGLIRGLDSNMGLARAFATAEAQTGDWRTIFTDLEELEKVTVDDLQRVANKYFTKSNRTVGVIINKAAGEVTDASK